MGSRAMTLGPPQSTGRLARGDQAPTFRSIESQQAEMMKYNQAFVFGIEHELTNRACPLRRIQVYAEGSIAADKTLTRG
jgi:hypothetical protein